MVFQKTVHTRRIFVKKYVRKDKTTVEVVSSNGKRNTIEFADPSLADRLMYESTLPIEEPVIEVEGGNNPIATQFAKLKSKSKQT